MGILEGRCPCTSFEKEEPHRHVRLAGGVAAPAANRPVRMVQAILSPFREKLRAAEQLSDLAVYTAGPSSQQARTISSSMVSDEAPRTPQDED